MPTKARLPRIVEEDGAPSPPPGRMNFGDEAPTQPTGLDAFLKTPASSDSGINGQILILVSVPALRPLLAYCLTAAGFRVRVAVGATGGVDEVKRFSPDLILLDARAPGFASTEIWRQIRAARAPADPMPAVVMFIGGEDDIDPRLGLELGPCDFVVYPFSVRDLVLRADNIVRARRESTVKAGATSRRRRYLVGPLELDADKHTATVRGVPVPISALEMRLLVHLIEQRGHLRSRQELLMGVWGYHRDVTTRTADIHVNRLRKKLGAAASLIETVRGAGYRLSSDHPVIVRD